jgi:hypothetical protein
MGWLAQVGPEIITNVFKKNKTTFILLGIILVIVLILKWFQTANQRLRNI